MRKRRFTPVSAVNCSASSPTPAIRLAGGRNIAENVRGFGELNKEALLVADPDVVIAYRRGKAPHAFGGELNARPVLRDLRA